MLFLYIFLPPLIGFFCVKFLNSKQWLMAMTGTAVFMTLLCGFLTSLYLGLFIGLWCFAAFFLPWIVLLWLEGQPFPQIDLDEMWHRPFFLLDKKTEIIEEFWGGAEEEDSAPPPTKRERKLRLHRKS